MTTPLLRLAADARVHQRIDHALTDAALYVAASPHGPFIGKLRSLISREHKSTLDRMVAFAIYGRALHDRKQIETDLDAVAAAYAQVQANPRTEHEDQPGHTPDTGDGCARCRLVHEGELDETLYDLRVRFPGSVSEALVRVAAAAL